MKSIQDEILENRIRMLEALLKEYIRIAKMSGQDPFKTGRVDEILDKLNELYKKRK